VTAIRGKQGEDCEVGLVSVGFYTPESVGMECAPHIGMLFTQTYCECGSCKVVGMECKQPYPPHIGMLGLDRGNGKRIPLRNVKGELDLKLSV